VLAAAVGAGAASRYEGAGRNLRPEDLMLVAPALALACSLAAPPASSAADPLWQKALAVAAANDGVLPRRMLETEKLMDVDGDVVATTVSTFELVREQGKVARRLVKATRNGKEFTEKKQKELDEGPGKDRELFRRSDNVFLVENQARVEVRRTARSQEIAGRRCAGYGFKLQGELGPVNGLAWLDEATGAPLLVEASPTAFPELEKVRLKAMTQRFGYRLADDGRWVLDSLKVRTELELKKLLDIGMVMESDVRFEDHARLGPPPKRP